MNPKLRQAQAIQIVGGIIFAIGAVLLAVGTTSIPLFLFYGVVAIAGLGVFAWGRKRYNTELKG